MRITKIDGISHYKMKESGTLKESKAEKLSKGLTEKNKKNSKKSYWEHEEALPAEAFAHFTSSTIMNPESLKVIKKYFPKSLAIYNEIIQDALGE